MTSQPLPINDQQTPPSSSPTAQKADRTTKQTAVAASSASASIPIPDATPAAAGPTSSQSASAAGSTVTSASVPVLNSSTDSPANVSKVAGIVDKPPTAAPSLQTVKDVDGVRLMVRAQILRGVTPPPPQPPSVADVTGVPALTASAMGIPATLTPLNSDMGPPLSLYRLAVQNEIRKPPPIAQPSPDRYRKLVKGLSPLKSSLSKRHVTVSPTTAADAAVASSTSEPTSAAAEQSQVRTKKSVQFCDRAGYDLYDVRIVEDTESLPDVPLHATAYLNITDGDDVGPAAEKLADGQDATNASSSNSQCKFLVALFAQPGATAGFMERVQRQKVVLEFCAASDEENVLHGSVRVANISFDKRVFVVFSYDNWQTKAETKAGYAHYPNDGTTDLFQFELATVPIKAGSNGYQIEFAIRYEAGSAIYWDNNFGKNYRIACRPTVNVADDSLSTVRRPWLHYL